MGKGNIYTCINMGIAPESKEKHSFFLVRSNNSTRELNSLGIQVDPKRRGAI